MLLNIEKHLKRLSATVYPEPIRNHHLYLTDKAIKNLVEPLNFIKDVLDVGCGQGVALKKFKEIGMNGTGITISDDDLRICQNKGYHVLKMDMHFMDFPEESFDLLWARHCIEHSPMPMITLLEFERLTRPGGYCYIEVPQDDSVHIDNPNHYAILSDRNWQSFIRRTKFDLLYRGQWVIQLADWVDIYWYYWLQKR